MASELRVNNIKNRSGLGTVTFADEGLLIAGITTLSPGSSLIVGSDTSTGTASQTLQVTGGAYVSGNLGIGTTNPGQTLDIFGVTRVTQTNNGQNGLLVEMPLGVENTASGIRVRGYSPAIELIDKDNVQNWYIAIDDNVTNNFQIARGYGPGQNIPGVIEITPSDNVGIGITNPQYKLDVNGDVRLGGTGNSEILLRTWSASDTDIDGLLAGSTFGTIIEGANNGHLVMGIRDNDAGDTFSIISGGSNYQTDTTYDTLIASFKANGDVGVGAASAGQKFYVEQSGSSRTAAFHSTSASYAELITFAQANRSDSSSFSYFFAYNNSTADTQFILRGDGQAYADGSWNGGGADYAEMFEWEDGNPNNEDRVGYTVSLINNKIQVAEEGEDVIGVVSGNPSVIGDTSWNKWNEKYLKDEFNRYIFEEHNVVEWTDEDGKEHSYEDWNLPNDVVVPVDAVTKTHDEKGNRFTHRKLNPEYNPDLEYVAREDRQEWDAIGLVGKLRVRKGQVIGSRWIKMRDINENVEEWLVR